MVIKMEQMNEIRKQAAQAVRELLEVANLKAGDLFVIGCSSSEMVGERIGKGSSMDAAVAVYDAVAPLLAERGIGLVAQCCEHLNRALIIERSFAEKYGYEIACVRPHPHAGGSFATTVWQRMEQPVAVEQVVAQAGMDIGGTLIGMHLQPVAVPVRLSIDHIGEALLLCARTRPKFVGGSRAVYNEALL